MRRSGLVVGIVILAGGCAGQPRGARSPERNKEERVDRHGVSRKPSRRAAWIDAFRKWREGGGWTGRLGDGYWPEAEWKHAPSIRRCAPKGFLYRWRDSEIGTDGTARVGGVKAVSRKCWPYWVRGRYVLCKNLSDSSSEGSSGGVEVWVLDLMTGRMLSQRRGHIGGNLLEIFPALQLVISVSMSHWIMASSLIGGTIVWKERLDDDELSGLLVPGVDLYSGVLVLRSASYGYRFGRDARTGRLLWETASQCTLYRSCQIGTDAALDVYSGQYFSLKTGRVLQLLLDDKGYRLMAPDGPGLCVGRTYYSAGKWRHRSKARLYCEPTTDAVATVSALDTVRGRFLWKRPMHEDVASLLVSSDVVLGIIAHEEGGGKVRIGAIALDRRTGRQLWVRMIRTTSGSNWRPGILGIDWNGRQVRFGFPKESAACLSFPRSAKAERHKGASS